MPHGTKRDYRIEDIIERGTKVMSQTMEHLDEVPTSDRDRDYVRSLSDLMLAATAVQKENRAALEFMERHKPDPSALLTMLTEYLRGLPAAEMAAIVESVRKGQPS